MRQFFDSLARALRIQLFGATQVALSPTRQALVTPDKSPIYAGTAITRCSW
jgi:hypothetical protein